MRYTVCITTTHTSSLVHLPFITPSPPSPLSSIQTKLNFSLLWNKGTLRHEQLSQADPAYSTHSSQLSEKGEYGLFSNCGLVATCQLQLMPLRKKEEEEVEFHYSIISAVTFSKQQMFKIKQQPGPMNGFMEVHGFSEMGEIYFPF